MLTSAKITLHLSLSKSLSWRRKTYTEFEWPSNRFEVCPFGVLIGHNFAYSDCYHNWHTHSLIGATLLALSLKTREKGSDVAQPSCFGFWVILADEVCLYGLARCAFLQSAHCLMCPMSDCCHHQLWKDHNSSGIKTFADPSLQKCDALL